MFALHFFCQGTHCPDTVVGQICTPPGMIKLANRPVCLGLRSFKNIMKKKTGPAMQPAQKSKKALGKPITSLGGPPSI